MKTVSKNDESTPVKIAKSRPKKSGLGRTLKTSQKTTLTDPVFTAGRSLDRPTEPNLNDIYYEFDTGNRVRFNGSTWDIIDNLK